MIAERPTLSPGERVGPLRIVGPALRRDGERLHRATADGSTCLVEVLEWPDAEAARRAAAHDRRLLDAAPTGLLPLLAVDCDGRRSWRVYRPIAGEAFAERAGPASLQAQLDVGEALAAALVALHGAGLVHGDLRLVCAVRAATDGALCVFGAGRLPGARLGLGPRRVGPSPEQARGEPAGPPADVHALGLALYRLCGGGEPFAARDGIDLATALSVTTPAPLPSDVDPRLRQLIERLTRKAPRERPTAAEALRAIEGIRRGDPLPAGRRTRMVGRATRPLNFLSDDTGCTVAVLGALPDAVVEAAAAAGLELRPAEDVPDATVLLVLGAAPGGLRPLVDRWPAVVADVDPRDIARLTALARMGLAGVVGRPLDPERVVRSLIRALRRAPPRAPGAGD